MQQFSRLFRTLDETTKTSGKLAALQDYFASAEPADAAWAIYFLCGRKPKRLIASRNLRAMSVEMSGLPDWLFDECYEVVGDVAETIALLLPEPPEGSTVSLAEWVEQRLLPLRNLPDDQQQAALAAAWQQLDTTQQFLFNKLLTGGFRVGVSQKLVVQALAQHSGLEPAVLAHRLMGDWQPSAEFLDQLLAADVGDADPSRPYPFCLAYPLQADPATIGPVTDWLAEWKWDGIRAQVIRRQGQTFIWSRGEELITERFPEVTAVADRLPDGTVLDGELVGWKNSAVLPFGELQRRIGRKTVGRKLLNDVPVRFIAFDQLEAAGRDVRDQPLSARRQLLQQTVSDADQPTEFFAVSVVVSGNDWQDLAAMRETSREQNVEGLMLKRLDSTYQVGRVSGQWWKWKVEPYTCDAVLVYAQRGSGRRASLYTDYTFAIWNDSELVPFAKAYSGLTDEEMQQVNRFVRQNTLEKFGPVCRVAPELVFELAFENIQASTRHKSGIAVRFPRMLRWRRDKRPADADTLQTVLNLLPQNSGTE